MSEYDEDLKKACEILNNTELDELLQVAVEAMDDAATDIGMEANQEWHAKITLESALIHIAEKVAKRPSLTIPKSIAESDWMKHLILCSSITQFEFERYDFLDKEEERFLKWVNTRKNEYILYIYLAGKALGVDLVKVI